MKQNLLSIAKLGRAKIESLFALASSYQSGEGVAPDCLHDKILACFFLEQSTRTRLSFESAMLRLGGKVLNIPSLDSLRFKKFESLSDTILTLTSYVDILIVRTPDEDSFVQIAEASQVPVINAGNGHKEHPSQALLDLYTIHSEKQGIDGLHIVTFGDSLHSRSAHSLVLGLSKFDVRISVVSPKELSLPDDIVSAVRDSRAKIEFTEELMKVLPFADVLYVWGEEPGLATETFCSFTGRFYELSPEIIGKGKQDLIILHPFYRSTELPSSIDQLPQARYFQQMKNGMYLRMALLHSLLA